MKATWGDDGKNTDPEAGLSEAGRENLERQWVGEKGGWTGMVHAGVLGDGNYGRGRRSLQGNSFFFFFGMSSWHMDLISLC